MSDTQHNGGASDNDGMHNDTPINYTPTDLPPSAQARMADIRAARGTGPAMAYAQAFLSQIRYDANVAYMRRYVGSPGLLALRALAYHGALVLLFLWAMFYTLPPVTFLATVPCATVYVLCRAVAAYLDGGRS